MGQAKRRPTIWSKSPWIVAALAIVAALVAAVLWRREGVHKPPGAQAPLATTPGFQNEALERGLDFHMTFLSEEQGEHFKMNLYDHGAGVAVGDADGDGHEDLFFCNQLGSNALFKNAGNGTFQNVTARSGDLGMVGRVSVGAVFGDYDNDGDQDLFVTNTRGGNVLFENQGKGRFKDVSKAAGVDLVAHSQTAAFFDYDNDGDLDLFVTNTAVWTLDETAPGSAIFRGKRTIADLIDSPKELNILYRNNGDGTFTDVTIEAGMRGQGWGGDVAAFDYDEDGLIDLFVTNMFGRSQLYRNVGKGRFEDVTAETLKRTSYGAIGCKAFDVENDGRLDLLVADMHSDMWLFPEHSRAVVEPKKKYRYVTGRQHEWDATALERERNNVQRLSIFYEQVLFGNTLFRNEGNGKFTERSDESGMETFWPWGIATGDFNNDGFEDAFLPSGMGFPYFYYPSALLINRGDGTFIDRAIEEGIEPPLEGIYLKERIGVHPAPRSSRCAACADFDGDGRLEIVVNNFNDHPYFFQNAFPARRWVSFRLTGTHCNRDAIGATVRIFAGDKVLVRQVHAAGGYLSQSSRTLHFGLGDRTKIERVEIRWPGGRLQRLDPPAMNTLHRITEPLEASVAADSSDPARL